MAGFRWGGGLLAGAMVLLTAVGLIYTPYSPTEINIERRLEAPSLEHPLGTDNYGRDILSRGWGRPAFCWPGCRGLGLTIGTLWGLPPLLPGLAGRNLMRMADGLTLCLPCSWPCWPLPCSGGTGQYPGGGIPGQHSHLCPGPLTISRGLRKENLSWHSSPLVAGLPDYFYPSCPIACPHSWFRPVSALHTVLSQASLSYLGWAPSLLIQLGKDA